LRRRRYHRPRRQRRRGGASQHDCLAFHDMSLSYSVGRQDVCVSFAVCEFTIESAPDGKVSKCLDALRLPLNDAVNVGSRRKN
jgi:hypothetical protein